MTTLFLITHAHTAANPDVDARAWTLSPTGARQAQRLAEQAWWDQVTHVVLSSEAKTRLTVAPVLAARALAVAVDPRLDELQRGGWTPDYVGHVQQTFTDPEHAHGGWEAAAAAHTRVRAAIDALAARGPDQTIAVVSHGLVLSLYRAGLLGLAKVRLDDWRRLSFAAVAQVDHSGSNAVLTADFAPVAEPQSRA